MLTTLKPSSHRGWHGPSFRPVLPVSDRVARSSPGDYVVEQKTEVGPAEYGVVQRVDHAGRTALVNWYQIYLFGSDARCVPV